MSKAKAKCNRVAETECPDEATLANYFAATTDTEFDAELEQHIENCHRCRESLDILELESDALGEKLRRADQLEPHFSETSRRVDAILARAKRDSIGTSEDAQSNDGTRIRPTGKFRVSTELRIGDFHAEGGLGQVWTSTDSFGRTLALKVIKPARARDPLVRRRFLQEARLTARLTHPSIVTVHGAGTNERDEPFYSMNFVDGVTLESVIETRTKTTVQLLQSFIDVCNAIQYAHEKNVIHRDIKPNNILLGTHGETTVVDWGLARFVDDAGEASEDSTIAESASTLSPMTQHGSRLGTPQYMSPEQASENSAAVVGPLSDVYSLGATLYAILTGKAPFDGSDTKEICEKVQRGDFVPPSQIEPATPRALEAICLKAMAVVPTDRYESAEHLRQDIDRWLEDRPVTAYVEPWSAKAGRWLKRHRTFASVSLATVLVATLALGIELSRARAANSDLEQVNRELQERVHQLATAQQNLARELYDRRDLPRSLGEFSVALQLREQLYAAQPTDVRRFELVEAWGSVALAQHKSKNLRSATESYKVALEHLNQLLANAPENTDYLTMRCRILGNRGMTDLVLAGSERAAGTYVEAIESVEKLIRVAGATLDRTKEVARLNGNLADAVAVTEDKERELTHRRRAISLLKELVVDHQQEGADQFIGVHAVRLTMTLLRLQREDEALRELQDITTYCEQIESGETHNSGQQFNAAKCLVFLSEHEPDRYKSDSLAFRAVVVLRGMRKSGFFQREPHLIQQLESEPWVDKLRERTDFRELLTELSAVSRADPS